MTRISGSAVIICLLKSWITQNQKDSRCLSLLAKFLSIMSVLCIPSLWVHQVACITQCSILLCFCPLVFCLGDRDFGVWSWNCECCNFGQQLMLLLKIWFELITTQFIKTLGIPLWIITGTSRLIFSVRIFSIDTPFIPTVILPVHINGYCYQIIKAINGSLCQWFQDDFRLGTTMDASGCIWINIHRWWINSCRYRWYP
jgi:hypothetical protein